MKRAKVSLIALMVAASGLALVAPLILANEPSSPVLVDLAAPATPEQVARLEAAGLRIGMAYRHLSAVSGNLAPRHSAETQALDFVRGLRADSLRTLDGLRGEFARGPPEPIASTYNLDFIDAEGAGTTGKGVYVAVLDSGLVPNWRDYLEDAKVREDLGRSYTGANGNPTPDMLDRDTGGHGTAVAATVIGYILEDKLETGQFFPTPATGRSGDYLVPGVAPDARIIPIKVCDNGVYCWDSSIYSALDYLVGLRMGEGANGELRGASIVVNLSLGGPSYSEAERRLFEAVTAAGILIVASAGNGGDAGMGWPAAYPVVISVAAGGWRRQFYGDQTVLNNQWWMDDVPEGAASIDEWFMVWWSSREYADRGQELDVTATGRFMLLPYQASGAANPPPDPKPADGIPSEYIYISGTSFSAPTTAGVAALMLEANPALTQAQAEAILRSTALPIPAGSWRAGFPFPADNEWDESKSSGGPGTKTGWGLVQADEAVVAAGH